MIELWIVSGLLSLWYFIRVSNDYPDTYEWNGIREMNVGDLFVICAIILGGMTSLLFVIICLSVKVKDVKLFRT